MTEQAKTHYRKAFNSPYLSSADIVDPVVLTISHVLLESDRSKQSKDDFNTAFFAEREIRPGEALKPMILNATNSKLLAQITGSKWIEDWRDVLVEVRVESGIQFGREKVDGLRLAKAARRPAVASPALIAAGKDAAKSGTSTLRGWWEKLDEPTRELMMPHFRGLRADASKVDAAKTAPADQTSEAPAADRVAGDEGGEGAPQ